MNRGQTTPALLLARGGTPMEPAQVHVGCNRLTREALKRSGWTLSLDGFRRADPTVSRSTVLARGCTLPPRILVINPYTAKSSFKLEQGLVRSSWAGLDRGNINRISYI